MSNSKKTTYQVVRDLLEGDSFDEGTVAEISTRVNRAESGVRNALMRLRSEGVVTFQSDGGRGATTWSAKDEPEAVKKLTPNPYDGLTSTEWAVLAYLWRCSEATVDEVTRSLDGVSRVYVRAALLNLEVRGLLRTEGEVWYPTPTDDPNGLSRQQRDILEYLRDDNPGGTIGFGAIQIGAAIGTSRLDAWDALMGLSQLGLVRTEGNVWYPTLTGDQEKKTPEPEPEPTPTSPFDGLTRRQRNILRYLQDGNRGYAGEIAAAVGGMGRLDAWDDLMCLDRLGLARTEGDRWFATLQFEDMPEPEPEPEPETAPEPDPILDLANAVKGLRDGDVEARDIHKMLQTGLQLKMVELAKSAVNGGGSVTYSSNPDGGIELWIHGPEQSSTSQVIAALTRAGDWG